MKQLITFVVRQLRPADPAPELVRVCAWTRKIEFHGEWMSLEEYLSRRFNIAVTHGISPDAATRALTPPRRPQPTLLAA
jgi:hypothetical protein